MTSTAAVDEDFTTPVGDATRERAAAALRERGFDAHVAPDSETAWWAMLEMIPSEARVLTSQGDRRKPALRLDPSGACHDLEAAFRRIRLHCSPLEDERARRVCGQPSSISKALVVESERCPGRSSVILVLEAVGF